jgi:sucrose-6-phosphate hydrolase SacC (GH32 family)
MAQRHVSAAVKIPLERNTTFELETTVSADAKQQLNIDLRNSEGEKVAVGYDWDKRQLYVNRGDTRGFEDPFFTSDGSSFLPLPDEKLKLHVLVDTSIIEVFVNDDERVATMVYFMQKPPSELRVSAEKGAMTVENLKVQSLRSIWQ